MFQFFRRHQRAIFLVVTTIIILSFSFFGTYSAVVSTKGADPVVFTTLHGKKIRKSECVAYQLFLSQGGIQSLEQRMNFFNDGFLEKDILSTGVGEAIFAKWQDKGLAEYLIQKKSFEKSYHLYQHPQAPFLSTEYVWSYFAPSLKDSYFEYQKTSSDNIKELFKKKAELFTSEKQCPGIFVKQMLLYQQKQAAWLAKDPLLDGKDFSLFAYTSATDWFGEAFLEKVVETVIDGAEQASREGLSVSDEEVETSLYATLKKSASLYADLADRPVQELVEMSLRSLGLDFATVKKIEKTLLLYRMGYTTLSDHIAVSAFPFRHELADRARTKAIDVYSLQPALRVNSNEELAELYLWKQAVLAPSSMPTVFSEAYLSPEEVQVSWPEFVQERFFVSCRMVGPEQLEPFIKLKELWNWQAEEKNFARLSEKFPRLLEGTASDPESRMKVIEALPISVRRELDQYSKRLFIQDHPDWIAQEMTKEEPLQKVLFLRPRGESSELEGISNMRDLAALLRKAPIGKIDDHLQTYSQDGLHFYEFVLQDRSAKLEHVPLIQLRQDGTLNRVFKKVLEAQYPSLRRGSPKPFLRENGEWKPFQEVELQLVDAYLAPLYQKLDQVRPEMEKKYPTLCQWKNHEEARLALFTLPLVLDNIKMMEMKGSVVSKPVRIEDVMSGSKEAIDQAEDTLFDFVKAEETIRASNISSMPQLLPLFDSLDMSRSAVLYYPSFGTSYVVVKGSSVGAYDRELRSILYALDGFLADSARRQKIEELLYGIKD